MHANVTSTTRTPPWKARKTTTTPQDSARRPAWFHVLADPGPRRTCFPSSTGTIRDRGNYASPFDWHDLPGHPQIIPFKYCCDSGFSTAKSGECICSESRNGDPQHTESSVSNRTAAKGPKVCTASESRRRAPHGSCINSRSAIM